MRRIFLFSLMAVACLTMQAQKNDVKFLAKCGTISRMYCPEATIDSKTKKKTVVWRDTENNTWHENMGLVKKVPTIDNLETIFPDLTSFRESKSTTPILWQLTEENDETVLHCYLTMPADVVENFWLCSEECVILDKETGIIYPSRRCVPDCYGKVFSFKAKEGSVIDFQIFFPKLPDTAKRIAIYGVPNWYMRGMNVNLETKTGSLSQGSSSYMPYDEMMPIHKAHLVREAKDYDKDNFNTWAVYDDPHLIKPVADGTFAIWRTPDATYLAEACEKNWMREYFSRGGNVVLVDKSGEKYECKEVVGYPLDDIFWVEGWSGDHFALVMVFEPIPPYLENIVYIEPEGEPFKMWGADWSGRVLSFDIQELRDNQKLFEYHPREVVK